MIQGKASRALGFVRGDNRPDGTAGAEPMTTLRQTLANRRNARLSTGPRSPQGLQASSRNAVRHGLTAEQMLLEEDHARIRARLEKWEPELRPVGEFQHWLLEEAVSASVRIDRCREREDAWLLRLSQRAATNWD